MNIVIIHHFYRNGSASGENTIVEAVDHGALITETVGRNCRCSCLRF